MLERKIIHVDMDAFYVSVEIRDNPNLKDKPVAVGGKSDRRGVLSTCNYLARKFGVSSAMPVAMAKQKCPHLVIVPGRMDVYKSVSAQIRKVFEKYTDKVEPLSLDEAYLDVSESKLFQGSATLLAQQIRQDIFKETGLTASAGIAPVKFLAKIASEQNKPNGQFTLPPDKVIEFIESLPLKHISGVGKVTNEKLKLHGFHNGKDVRESSQAYLNQHFGKMGQALWQKCQGIDDREVQVSRVRKSVGVERTFEFDVSSTEELSRLLCEKLLPELIRRAEVHLRSRKMNKLGVKLKFADFQLTTKEQRADDINIEVLNHLLVEAMSRGKGKAVRLLGIHIGLETTTILNNQLKLALEFSADKGKI